LAAARGSCPGSWESWTAKIPLPQAGSRLRGGSGPGPFRIRETRRFRAAAALKCPAGSTDPAEEGGPRGPVTDGAGRPQGRRKGIDRAPPEQGRGKARRRWNAPAQSAAKPGTGWCRPGLRRAWPGRAGPLGRASRPGHGGSRRAPGRPEGGGAGPGPFRAPQAGRTGPGPLRAPPEGVTGP
jgi:hypothetical protein